MIQAVSKKPSGERRLCRGSFDARHAMRRSVRDAKEDGVTRPCVWQLTQDGACALLSKLKRATHVWPGSQVETHADEAMLSVVIVPRVVVVLFWNHAVHTTFESGDRVAAGKVSDESQE